MEENINKRLRKFGFFFSIGMILLFTISYFKNFNKIFLIIISFLFMFHILFAIFYPKVLIITFYPIDFIAKTIGNIINFLVFTMVFFLFFTPISFFLRLFGKDQIAKISKTPQWFDVNEKENEPERVKKLY